jgi:hypothetical protein
MAGVQGWDAAGGEQWRSRKTLVALGLGQLVSIQVTATGFASSELSRRGPSASPVSCFVLWTPRFLSCGGRAVSVRSISPLLHATQASSKCRRCLLRAHDLSLVNLIPVFRCVASWDGSLLFG